MISRGPLQPKTFYDSVDIPSWRDCGGIRPQDRAVLQGVLNRVADGQHCSPSLDCFSKRKINVSQEHKKNPVTPCLRHSSRPVFSRLAFDRHDNSFPGEAVGGSWWIWGDGQWYLELLAFLKRILFFSVICGKESKELESLYSSLYQLPWQNKLLARYFYLTICCLMQLWLIRTAFFYSCQNDKQHEIQPTWLQDLAWSKQ